MEELNHGRVGEVAGFDKGRAGEKDGEREQTCKDTGRIQNEARKR